MKRLITVLLPLLLAVPVLAADQPKLLPEVFAGWQKHESKLSTDPAVAEPTNPALMTEFGFIEFEQAIYVRPERKMTVKAARFADATGAYGAFTYYKTPAMLNEKFGDQAATLNERVLFYRGNVLVQATLDKITAMSAGELRELGESILLPAGNARNLPTLPGYLPRESYVKNSAKYVLGPVGYSNTDSFLPASLVDFSRGTEVAMGKYTTRKGKATILLIAYPTPAIAGERLRAIDATNKAAGPMIYSKRTGPMLVLVSGQVSEEEARNFLASVNYDADITWNEKANFSKKDNVANLLINIAILIGIIFLFALAAGVAFGGLRLLVKRFFPGKVFDRTEDVEIIQLRLNK